MTTAKPVLVGLSGPATIDLTDGAVAVSLDALVSYRGGSMSIPGLSISFDKAISFSTPGYQQSNQRIINFGDTDLRYLGATDDTFNDATPTQSRSTLLIGPATVPGTYTIVGAHLGHDPVPTDPVNGFYPDGTWYKASELTSNGLGLTFTVVNRNSPPPPVIHSQSSDLGYITSGRVTLEGSATPNTTVEVSGVRGGMVTTMGTANVAADGTWKFTSDVLDDDRYTGIHAKTIDSAGNGSPYSQDLSFTISKSAPMAPTLASPRDQTGLLLSKEPVFAGTTIPGALIHLYAGEALLGTAIADAGGNWHLAVPVIADGNHVISATATDPAGRVSDPATMSIRIDPANSSSIEFTVGSMVNTTTMPISESAVQGVLDRASAVLSAALWGKQSIPLAVEIAELGNATASAGAAASSTSTSGMPDIHGAMLTISANFTTWLMNEEAAFLPNVTATMVHELVHVLGFNAVTDPAGTVVPYVPGQTYKYNDLIKYEAGKPVFIGKHAVALNGGAVSLDSSLAHVADWNSVMSPSGGVGDSPNMAPSNNLAPLSDIDIAMLVDLGFVSRNDLVSTDGHTIIAGYGTQVSGTAGLDRLFYVNASADYSIKRAGDAYIIDEGADGAGVNQVTDIERVIFGDRAIALDIDGVGGQAYRLYQAAFDRQPDLSGIGFWLAQMDGNLSLHDVAGEFIKSAEFEKLFGTAPSAETFVSKLYNNVLHRTPDAEGYQFWVNAMSTGTSREDVLVQFSESAENQAQVMDQIENGFAYLPFLG